MHKHILTNLSEQSTDNALDAHQGPGEFEVFFFVTLTITSPSAVGKRKKNKNQRKMFLLSAKISMNPEEE